MQIASSRNPPKRLRSNFVLPEYAVEIPRLQAREDVKDQGSQEYHQRSYCIHMQPSMSSQ